MEASMEAEKEPTNIGIKRLKDDLKHLVLKRVKLTGCVLGQGSYATVYKAIHNGTTCAAKQADLSRVLSVKVSDTYDVTRERVKQNFFMECLQHNKLRHPNIVMMLGVFYPKKETILPVLVMELMEYNLTQLLERSHNILMYVKLSILQDVSKGLTYLHAQSPPIVHQALYSDNILFTKGLIAKIGDFKTGAETVSDQALLSTRRNRRSWYFLPDLQNILKYDLPLNVFSFGCIVCHVITQELPEPPKLTPWNITGTRHSSAIPRLRKLNVKRNLRFDDMAISYTIDDWSVKNQNYIDLISDNSLKQLVEACLQCDPEDRPCMLQIYEKITSIMAGEFRSYS